MASVSSVNGKKVSKLKFNDTIYDMGGSKNEPITITQNGTYTAPEGVGYSPISVSVPQVAESGTVKNLLDATKSSTYLFKDYKGTSVDDLISYSDTENVTNMSYMFNGCENLTSIPELNTSSVTNMSYMFSNCINLVTIPPLDTSKVGKCGGMFISCKSLISAPEFDFSSIYKYSSSYEGSVSSMFSYCTSLINVPFYNINDVYSVSDMFSNCTSLENIHIQINGTNQSGQLFYNCTNLRKIDFEKINISNTGNTFANCYNLRELIFRDTGVAYPFSIKDSDFNNCYHFTGTVNETYNPDGLKDGRIYVPDYLYEMYKIKTNWTLYADIIRPLSLYQKNIGDLNIANTLNINNVYTTQIYLDGFTENPNVSIISDNEAVLSISNLMVSTDKITFSINTLSIGTAKITIEVNGEHSRTQTLNLDVIEYRVEKIGNYGFELDNSCFYKSTNRANNTRQTSKCKITFNIPENTTKNLIIEYISMAQGVDCYGILSSLDEDNELINFKGQVSTKVKSFKYENVTQGEHYLYISYRRGYNYEYSDDSFQFYIRFE